MNNGLSIRPSKDIRTNYAMISELARQNPVAITVNGKEDTVLMSHEDFISSQKRIARLEAELEIYKHLAQSADDIKLGRVQLMNNAVEDICNEIDGLDL